MASVSAQPLFLDGERRKRMALTIVTEPASEPVSTADINDHLRLTGTSGSGDTIIAGLITAARRHCERFQNRSYIEQTWKLILDDFPDCDYIEIPRPPLMSATSIVYYSTGGTATTMTAANYYIDKASEPGRLHLQYGESWPTQTLRPAAGVEVQFIAGYGSAAASVPGEIKLAIKLLVGHVWEHRENTDIKEIMEIAYGVSAMLWPERVVPI